MQDVEAHERKPGEHSAVADRIDEERPAGTKPRDRGTAQRRADHAGRIELCRVEGDPSEQLFTRDDLTDDRLPGGKIKAGGHANQHRDGHVGPRRAHTAEPQCHQAECDAGLKRLRNEEHLAAGVPVGDRPAVGPHQGHGKNLGETGETDPAGTVGEVEDDKRDGERLEPPTDVRRQATEPEQPVVPKPEDREALAKPFRDGHEVEPINSGNQSKRSRSPSTIP